MVISREYYRSHGASTLHRILRFSDSNIANSPRKPSWPTGIAVDSCSALTRNRRGYKFLTRPSMLLYSSDLRKPLVTFISRSPIIANYPELEAASTHRQRTSISSRMEGISASVDRIGYTRSCASPGHLSGHLLSCVMLLPPVVLRWSESTLVTLTEKSINLVRAPTVDVLRTRDSRVLNCTAPGPTVPKHTRPCGSLRCCGATCL